jgi:hypothetical protein
VNQVASLAPVSAWTFGDPEEKFHHGVHFDPKCLTFAPVGKMRHPLRAKLPDKTFVKLDACPRDCAGTFAYSRTSIFHPPTFFSTTYAHWGGAANEEAHTRRGQKGVIDDPEQNAYVLASMMLGIRLLHYLGCPRIYLLGVDLWMTEEKQYAFDQEKQVRNGRYSDENKMLNEIKPVADMIGFGIYNCNPESRCTAFPFVPFNVALEDCRGAVPCEPFDTAHWYDKSPTKRTISVAELVNIQRSTRCTTQET